MSTSLKGVCFWSVTKFLTRVGKCISEPPYALIILNQPISRRNNVFHTLWENANLKICADGGGNQLYEAFEGTDKQQMYIPHYIRGDLDSLRDDVKDFYISKGAEVERDPDQNSTDFMKCIELVRRKERESSVKHEIVALGTFGGRVDQAMSNIHYLYKLKNERRIYLLSDQNMTILLDKGKHQIHCNQAIEGPSCGIIPIGIERAIVTTTGLEWNLTNSSTSFGEMISTSNHLTNDIVMIETDSPILWTVELKI
ncbi:thiamine pyrophosphokinase [Gigaspora margarita]|uniref:Thiamine pyrophosphokinase n=3 Tax=Gigaspora margarita TaxID=4874 RepID=A0A8H4AI73_GIGMA|nr:thiamine pyrophosphokinase [Gigaspora margarita]